MAGMVCFNFWNVVLQWIAISDATPGVSHLVYLLVLSAGNTVALLWVSGGFGDGFESSSVATPKLHLTRSTINSVFVPCKEGALEKAAITKAGRVGFTGVCVKKEGE